MEVMPKSCENTMEIGKNPAGEAVLITLGDLRH
jgi:hypothetical protein